MRTQFVTRSIVVLALVLLAVPAVALPPFSIQWKAKYLEGSKDEPCDFRRVAQIMRDSGYRGYIVLEYEERDDPRQACPKFIDELRKAFA